MFTDLLRFALSNLLRARIQLAMTAGGVLIGTLAVILFLALTVGLQNIADAACGTIIACCGAQI